MMRPYDRHIISMGFFLFLCCFIPLISCHPLDKVQEGNAPKAEPGIHKTFERGPVTVAIDIDKKEITLAERLNFTISVTADESYDVELPRFGDKLEQFGIKDYHTTQPELVENNRTRVSRTYVLEPFLSGDYKIPPMKIKFWEKGKKETSTHEMETEEIIIKVLSLLPEQKEELKLHDIKPPVELPMSPYVWVWIWGSVIGAVVILLLIFLVRKYWRKREEHARQKIPAHEQAYMALEALVAEDLLGKGEIKLFYQKLSNILRYYIENRFGLRAPEQTTEEFLAGIDSGDKLPEKYNPLLRTFLMHCDLVKFAEHQPTTDDIQKTFDSCKAFIAETKEQEVDGN